ncbi:FACT complex subunit Ssrp1-like isoform X5 [Armigeres subalbatus]|uniref:FACT complex subunit Ssrp1-like isoform X5 n=1 Tax=Armigeres subalbatus TaxID=124917 RepID=UPI002ED271DF
MNFRLDMLEKELPTQGWNWGTIHFKGSVLSFDVESRTNIEIPLSHVSQCNSGKNEVTVEFHRNDDAPVSLMEMRFHIPMTESAETNPVEISPDQVMKQASVISATCDAIAIFREIHCLHGKTHDFKIPTSPVLRFFLLPHKDNRQMFFVISLNPPIKQVQTRYHFLVTLFQTISPPSMEPEYRNWITNLIGHDAAIPRCERSQFSIYMYIIISKINVKRKNEIFQLNFLYVCILNMFFFTNSKCNINIYKKIKRRIEGSVSP